MRRSVVACICLVSVAWLVAQSWTVFSLPEIAAQDKSKSKAPKKKGNSNVLDVKANEIQGEFIKSAESLATDYYELKEYDKARSLLKSIQALDPERAGLAAKMKLLDENQITSNEVDVEVNPAKPWDSTGVLVTAGKPIRIKADGNYRFAVSSQVGPTGFNPAKEPTPLDMVAGLPIGSLIGIVHSEDRAQTGQPDNRVDKKKDEAKEEPFLIGEGCDYTPQKDGLLFLRVNAPPENKNTGKIKVQITGGLKVGK